MWNIESEDGNEINMIQLIKNYHQNNDIIQDLAFNHPLSSLIINLDPPINKYISGICNNNYKYLKCKDIKNYTKELKCGLI